MLPHYQLFPQLTKSQPNHYLIRANVGYNPALVHAKMLQSSKNQIMMLFSNSNSGHRATFSAAAIVQFVPVAFGWAPTFQKLPSSCYLVSGKDITIGAQDKQESGYWIVSITCRLVSNQYKEGNSFREKCANGTVT